MKFSSILRTLGGQRNFNHHRKTDSFHLFAQKSFKRDDISVNIGFKWEHHAVGCETADVNAPTAALTHSSVCQQVLRCCLNLSAKN